MPLLNINDLSLYYDLLGSGEPVLLLHGFTGIGADWRLIFKEPTDGLRMILPDMRGHGRSTNPSDSFTFHQAALDMFALLDQLGVQQFKAIGLSGGAQALLHMSTQQPSRVEAMVLVSTAPYFSEQARTLMSHFTVDRLTEDEWRLFRTRHAQGDEQIKSLWRQGQAFKDSYDDVNFSKEKLNQILARTLIVHGDRDPFYPVEIATAMYRNIPQSSLWVLPNCGHGEIFGTTAEAFARQVMDFLK